MKSKYQDKKKIAAKPITGTKPDEQAKADEAWKIFEDFLKQRGDRITETRRIVLQRSLARTDHFRADDLAAELTSGTDRVSRGTVYRTLALLVEAGLIREIRDSDTHVHYEPVFGREHHEHLICDKCGRFIEFTDKDLIKHIDRACENNNFKARTHRVVIFGICEKCR